MMELGHDSESNSVEADTPPSNELSDIQDAVEYVKRTKLFPTKKQVCVCGHTIGAHTYLPEAQVFACLPNRLTCLCPMPVPVFAASNANFFKRSTHGIGKRHALGMGIASLMSAGGQGEWLALPKCFVPDCKEGRLHPACLNRTGRPVPYSTDNSVFVCEVHIVQLGGKGLLDQP